MNRLTHDFPSLLRACQMSRTDFFCFVEGVDNDRYVYSQLTSSLFRKSELAVEYPTANWLSPSGKHGGKDPLIKFFNFLSSGGALSTTFEGEKTTFIFLLDKDVDDLRKERVRSKYVIYTEHYDLQNYLFIHGDVVNSAAAGASITVASLANSMGDQTAWLTQCTTTWKEWVTICLFLKINGISLAGYAKSSQVNAKEYGPIEQPLLAKYKALALTKSGLDQATFDMRYSDVEFVVNNLYATGQANQIFKGKWYLHWLENHLSTKHKLKVNHKSFASILSSNLDWNGRWARPYKSKITRIIKEHRQAQ